MATITDAGASVKEAVSKLVPMLRRNGLEAEERRWIPDENVKHLDESGVFQLAVPRRFGGLDVPLRDQVDVIAEVARGCGSTGWVVCAWVSSAWLVSLYPDRTQDEVFAGGSVRVSGSFTPSGRLVPAEGGYRLTGTWRFNTGVRGAHWNIHATTLEQPGQPPQEVFALVPVSDISIADDWHVSAAAGTGSFTTSTEDLFVPAHHVVDGVEALEGTAGERSNTGATGRNYGLIPYVMAASVPVYIGLAKAALDLFLDRVRSGRAIAYTHWTDQREHPYTQIRLAEAANKITAAEALSDRWIDLLQQRADEGRQLSAEESGTVRGQMGYAIQLAKEAVALLHDISGASIIQKTDPFQRVHRDIEALYLHGLMTPVGNLEVHGRILLGLDPNTEYL